MRTEFSAEWMVANVQQTVQKLSGAVQIWPGWSYTSLAAFLRFVRPMPQDALCVESQRIVIAPPVPCHIVDTTASLHKFPDVVDPNGFPSFIGLDSKRLTKMLPDFLLRGPICSR